MSQEPDHGRGPIFWWRLVDTRIGIIPLPLYPLLVAILALLVAHGTLKPDLTTMIPVLALGAFSCAELGRRLPLLGRIGAPAVFATFLPSFLVHQGWLPHAVTDAVTQFARSSNFLYLFIACIIVGSILGMERRVLIQGLARIFIPLLAGTLVAGAVGMSVGAALGLGALHSLLFIVVPIMGGGIGEGAIPLSIGYALLLHRDQGELFATILPPVMLGSLTAIILAGALDQLGRVRPMLTGRGRLRPAEAVPAAHHPATVGPASIAAAGLTAVTLYLAGTLAQELSGIPAPVAMLLAAVGLTLLRGVSPDLAASSEVVHRFFAVAITFPLLFVIGVAMTPWDTLMAALAPANLATIVATVGAMVATGFVAGRLAGLYPIDAAIVTACHSGQGGTGDVAILSAANRLSLMPFAQIATRIGGATVVTLTLLGLTKLG